MNSIFWDKNNSELDSDQHNNERLPKTDESQFLGSLLWTMYLLQHERRSTRTITHYLCSSPVDTLFSDYVSRAPAALRMTDNEILSSHSGERQLLHNSSPNHANSSRNISAHDTPESRIDEDETSNEAKGHSADDEGTQPFCYCTYMQFFFFFFANAMFCKIYECACHLHIRGKIWQVFAMRAICD